MVGVWRKCGHGAGLRKSGACLSRNFLSSRFSIFLKEKNHYIHRHQYSVSVGIILIQSLRSYLPSTFFNSLA